MASVSASREPDDRAARFWIPIRRTQSGERRHKVHTRGIRDLGCQVVDFGGLRDDAHLVPQPLDGGPCREDGSLEGELRTAVDARGPRREKAMPTYHSVAAGVLEKEAAGAVRVLRLPRLAAILPEKRGLLVPDERRDRHLCAQRLR